MIVDLSGTRARARRLDLLGGERAVFEGPALAPGVDEVLFTWIADIVSRAPRGVSSLSLVVPGIVDDVEGTVVTCGALGWTDARVADTLGARLGVPVIVQNDVHAMLRAETTFGAARGVDDVLFVTLAPTLGSAMIVGGVPVRGAHGAAGRIGLVRTAGSGGSSSSRTDREGPLERDLHRIASAFIGPDGTVQLDDVDQREAFGRFSTMLRNALQPIASALDPSVVVIAWPADPRHLLVEHMTRRWNGWAPVRIVPSQVAGPAASIGAGVLALDVEYDALCTADPREAD